MLNLGRLLVGLSCKTWQSPAVTKFNRIISHQTASLAKDLDIALDEVMNSIPPESGALSPGDTLSVFRSLSNKFESNRFNVSFKLIEHTKFPVLRDAAKTSLPYYKAGEIIDVFKVIRTLHVPLEDELSILIISTLRSHTYDMSLNEIMILDSFMRINGVKKTHLAEALQRDLVSRFNARTSQNLVNFRYFEHMRRMIRFVNLNWKSIEKESLENLSQNATNQKIDISTADEAMKIVMELSRTPDSCKYFKAVLQKAFDVWNSSDISIEMIEKVFQVLCIWKSRIDFDLYNDERFIDKSVRKLIACGDYARCFAVMRNMNKLRFSSHQLLDYLSEYVESADPFDKIAIENMITFLKACCLSDYILNTRLRMILSEVPLHEYLHSGADWPQFAIKLHNIGVYNQRLINAILNDETRFDAESITTVKQLKPISNEETENVNRTNTVDDRLVSDLRDITGPNRLLQSIRLDNEFWIPFLIKVNRKTRNLLSFVDDERESVNCVKRAKNVLLIAIVCPPEPDDSETFRLMCEKIIARRIRLIILNDDEWLQLPLSKQVEYLFSAIAYILRSKDKIVHITKAIEST